MHAHRFACMPSHTSAQPPQPTTHTHTHTQYTHLSAVEDDEFWIGITPLELGELPALQENVAVLGYPIGGGLALSLLGLRLGCSLRRCWGAVRQRGDGLVSSLGGGRGLCGRCHVL